MNSSPTHRGSSRTVVSLAAFLSALAALAADPRGSRADPATGAAAPGSPVEQAVADSLARELGQAGFENLTVTPRGDRLLVAYENRRLRTSAAALDELARIVPAPMSAFERRYSLVTARVDSFRGRVRVAYPSDAGFEPPPAGPLLSPLAGRADLDLGPVVTYELGRIFSPVQVRIEIEPRLRVHLWPGALATAALVVPIRNDFEPTTLDPDIDRIRPGPLMLDQFAWVPGAALLSASTGYFGDNRYGGSIGAARPLLQGTLLLDAQADLTGFLAFPAEGVTYSELRHVSGFTGVTWRPPLPGCDLGVRARAARFLYGDRGVEIEVRRTMGDLDVGYFVQRTDGEHVYGVRLEIPMPPERRMSGVPLRVQPVARFPIDFRDRAEPAGELLGGVASREKFLRQLNPRSLAARAEESRLAGDPAPGAERPAEWVSLTGMSGFVFTPWAGIIHDRGLELGYNQVPKAWAFGSRGLHADGIYYATLGFLPRIETGLRWTQIVGARAFEDIVPDSRLPDIDRMASVRVELLRPAIARPGLAVGVEDLEGTRRFHSSYAVAGTEIHMVRLRGRAALGYGFHAFDAVRRTLDGGFGAIELSPWRALAAQVEYDSDKWNAAMGLALPFGIRIRAALLHLDSPSLGAGWAATL